MSRAVTAEQIAGWGKKIACDCVHRGINPTESLRKLASDEQLNPDQIRRVAETTNIESFHQTLPLREGGDVRHELADAEAVIKEANAPKVAGGAGFDLADYATLPKVAADHGLILHANFGEHMDKVAEEFEKNAAQIMAVRQCTTPEELEELKLASMTLPQAYQELRDLEKVAAEFNLDRLNVLRLSKEALTTFKEMVRRMVKQGYEIPDLYEAAISQRPDAKDLFADVFGQITHDLDKLGYFTNGVKTAAPVDASLISKKLQSLMPKGVPLKMINGNHPITMQVNVVADLANKWLENARGINITKGKMEKAKRVITRIGGI